MKKYLLISTILLACASASAQDNEAFVALYNQTQAAAKVAFSKEEVAKLVSTAAQIHKMDSSVDSMIKVDDEHLIDCSVNPKPYGTTDKSKCGFKAKRSFGWYADPVLVVSVKGYVSAAKAKAGTIEAQDITIAEVSIQKPDPTGLE